MHIFLQPYSIVSLLSHGILLGILLAGFILMAFVFANARSRLHLTALLFNAVAILFTFTEGMILVSWFIGDPAMGRQFHRIQALAIALFIVLIPAFIEVTVGLPPLWKKINRAIFYLTLAFTTLLIIVAFAAPDLFISVNSPLQSTAPMNMRWAEARGQPGFLYPLRDMILVPLLFYMLGSFLYQFLVRRGLRYILLPIIGLLGVIIMALVDIVFIYSPIRPLEFMKDFSSFTSLGITLFIVLCLISVMQRYQDESREIEKARKIESLGILAGGIAHDFNNLLTAIIGHMSLVRAKIPVRSDAHASLDEAMKASGHAKDLAGELLLLSRGGEPRKKLISLRELLDESRSVIPPNSRIEVEYSIEPDLKNMYADKTQIVQILQNLIVNAFQAMEGSGRLGISASNATVGMRSIDGLPRGDYVKIVVRDTGRGISKADQARLFDPFFTTKGKGHGLGLTIVHRIVTLHGGTINLESREGAGTAFTLHLPASDDPLPRTVHQAKKECTPAGRALYLEDEGVIAAVVQKMLIALGFEADICARGEEATEMYLKAKEEGRPYAFVLLDILISEGKGGIETARELRLLDPSVIAAATSGYSDEDLAHNFQRYGFDAFLPKPFQLSDLKNLTEKLLPRRSEA